MAENTDYCRRHIDSLSDELMVKIFSMVDSSTKLKAVNRYEIRMSGGYKFSSDDYDFFYYEQFSQIEMVTFCP